MRIAIVGAGVFGTTLNLYLRAIEADIEIFEKQETDEKSQIGVCFGTRNRHISPNYIDWPYKEITDKIKNDTTAFPYLNWNAGTAKIIRQKIIDQAASLAEEMGFDDSWPSVRIGVITHPLS